jgi:DNA-binding CsgD family transcriptional regulator
MLRLSGDIRSPGPNQIPSHDASLHSFECYACSISITSCDFFWAVPLTQGGHPTWHPTFAAPPLLLGVRRENESALADLKKRFASLSSREREIMIHVAQGRLSKQIAGEIGIAQATVKVHRSRAMRKMNARSLPEFGQMAAQLNLMPEKSQRS